MQPASVASKYVTIKRPITLEDVRDHLTGRYCFAIFGFAASRRAPWAMRLTMPAAGDACKAPRKPLQLEGARPLQIDYPQRRAPRRRGAVVISAPVDAQAARHWAEHVAPICRRSPRSGPARAHTCGCRPAATRGSRASRRVWRSACPIIVPSRQASTRGGSSPARLRRLSGYKRRRYRQHPPTGRGPRGPTHRQQVHQRRAEPCPSPAAEVWRHLHDTTPPCAEQLPPNRHGKAKAPWRDEQQPSVHIYGPDKFHQLPRRQDQAWRPCGTARGARREVKAGVVRRGAQRPQGGVIPTDLAQKSVARTRTRRPIIVYCDSTVTGGENQA